MGAGISAILRYDTVKEDELNLCDMQELSNSRKSGNSFTFHKSSSRYVCPSCRVRLYPHVVIICSVAVLLVLVMSLSAVSFNYGKNVKENCDLDLRYLLTPYKWSDFEVYQNTSAEISDSMNHSIDPCNNFYEFACQGWPKKYPRPKNTSYWTMFRVLNEESDNIVTELMETPSQQHEIPSYKLAQNFYKSCTQVEEDDNQRDEKVLNFVWDTLEKYGGWPILYKNGTWHSTNFNWKKSMTDLERRFKTPTILNIFSLQDNNGTLYNNTIAVAPPSEVSRRRDLYKEMDDYSSYDNSSNEEDDDESEVDFIVNAAKLLMKFKGKKHFHDKVLRKQAKDIVAMESHITFTSLASALSTEERNDMLLDSSEKDDSKMTLDELQHKIDLSADNPVQFREILDLLYNPVDIQILEKENLTVVRTKYVLDILNYVQSANEQTLANYLHYKMLVYMMPMLTREFRELAENRQKEVNKAIEPLPRKRVCAQSVEESFRFAVGQKFVQRQFKSMCEFNDVLIQMKQMFLHIKDVLYAHKNSLNSFLEESKLDAFIYSTDICVGFPDWLFDSVKVQEQYVGLQLENLTTYVEQVLPTNEWAFNNQLKTLRQPKVVGACDWSWFPGEVAAFTYMEQFKLYFPLGILQRPFLWRDQSLALNYGTMGTIIGHELTHAFAELGWEKMKNGTLTKKATCLERQYSKFSLSSAFRNTLNYNEDENVFLSGSQTVDENFADNGGMVLAYKAFKLEESKGRYKGHAIASPVSWIGPHRYSNDQLFFIGFAQNFCGSSSKEGMRNRMKSDVHSPGLFRVLGTLQNSEEFANAWNCSVDSGMNPIYEKCSLLDDDDDYEN